MRADNRSNVQKGYIKNTATGSIMQFLYNPDEFSDRHSVEYSELDGVTCSYPDFQFVRGNAKTIDLKLFLYDSNGNDVINQIKFLNSFLPPAFRNKKAKAPPALIFAFGWYVKKCKLDEISVKYDMFDANLNPVKATATLKLTALGG